MKAKRRNKMFKEDHKNMQKEEKENRRIGKRRTTELKEPAIRRIDEFARDENSAPAAHYGKRRDPSRTQSIFGSQIVLQ